LGSDETVKGAVRSMTPNSFGRDNTVERVMREYPESEKQNPEGLAETKLSPSEAEQVWPEVLKHKWYMSERSGRDIGLRAAARDYFENVRKVKKRDEIRNTVSAVGALPFTRPFGYR
jgi:hypothetical protein